MKSSDIMSSVSSADAREAKANREMKQNPPTFNAGMGDDDDDFSDFFGDDTDDSPIGTSPLGNQLGNQFGSPLAPPLGSPLGTPNIFGQLNSPMQQQPIQQQDNFWDKFLQGLVEGVTKGFIEFCKDFVSSFKTTTARTYTKVGARMLIVAGVSALIGLILLIMQKSAGATFLLAAVLDAITGVGLVMFLYNKAKTETDTTPTMPNLVTPQFNSFSEDDEDDDFYDDMLDDEEIDFEDEDDFFNQPSSFEEAEDDFFGGTATGIFSADYAKDEPVDIDTALDKIVPPERGLVTRQYIYDIIMPVLKNLTKDYKDVTLIEEGTDIFDRLTFIVEEAAKLQINNEQDLPYLIEAEETVQYILLTIKRSKSLRNTDALAVEIAKVFAVNEKTGKTAKGVYATAFTRLDKIVVKIFKGDTSMVSIKDILLNKKDFVLDMENKLPVCLGLDGDGEEILVDFKNIDSLLVAGEPRTGKTWSVLSILTQLCIWSSPDEVEFYICDPKEGISDFKNFKLPHVKRFVTADADILSTLRYVVRVEAIRRKKLIGDNDKVNIWDYKKVNPDIKIPILYVLIDEVMTLSNRMEKDTRVEFQALLAELTSQLPAVGIRLIIIPHLVKDNILKKNVTDLMPCRISVMGGAEHIENTCGVRNFPHKLENKGNSCIKLQGSDAEFARPAVISNSNDANAEFFEFLRKMWTKIDSSYEDTSVTKQEENKKYMENLISESKKDIDDLDVFKDLFGGQ